MAVFEVGTEAGAAPEVLGQAVASGTAEYETPVAEGWKRTVRCRSRVLSERRRPGGCCGWYSG